MKGSEATSERFSAIFKTIRFAFDGERLYKTNEEFNWESRTVYLGFNYRFGSGKNKAPQESKETITKPKEVEVFYKN